MSMELAPALRERIENTIRGLTVDAVERAGIGHVGAAMGLARPAFQLWDRHLRFDPADPAWPLRDRFVLSAGHASMLLYSLLHLYGYDLGLEEIEQFRQLGSRTPGHPEYRETPGVEITTGPLGQGFGHAVGMALGARATRARYAGDGGPGGHFVYVVASDGDLMEGISYEASSFAGHLGLGNLIVLYDDNQVTIDGPTSITFSEDVRGRFEAQGWHVQAIDGEDVAGLDAALEAARTEARRPSIVITRTTIGHGSPNWAGLSKAHGGPLGTEEATATKQKLGIPLEPEFLVPEDVRAYLKERIAAKQSERAARDEQFSAWRGAHTQAAKAFEAALAKRLPEGLAARLCEGMGDKADATRKHSGAVIQRAIAELPFLIGGSADLAGSNNTTVKEDGYIERGSYASANVHFGIREHSMAAITNGIALDGALLPFCGTFMVFSDYMRPSIRLAALMKLRSTFVFTHDSIFVGEDGPTHQPIEHLDALRAIPGLVVLRPADGIEVAMAWTYVLRDARGPVALSLTRQGVPQIDRPADFDPEAVLRGGYVLRETGGAPGVVLLASGSEVGVALGAANLLAKDGVEARVVSVPSLELLMAQPSDYVDALVPRGVPTVAVEAALGESYRRLVGRDGLVYGIDRFGASAPWQRLAEYFGFTPEKLAAAVRDHLAG